MVAGTMLKILTTTPPIASPAGLIMVYPALDLNFTSWMSDEQIRLLRQESIQEMNSPGLMQRKESFYHDLSGNFHLDSNSQRLHRKELEAAADVVSSSENVHKKNTKIGTELAMTSRVSYFGDKIITPEMLRAMVILYVGPENKPDFTVDYLLSPANAPMELLAKFPKVYLMCGEVDPLVVSTINFFWLSLLYYTKMGD